MPTATFAGLVATLAEPYGQSAGAAGSKLVPGEYDISIGDHPYLAETSFEPYRRDAYRSDSVETIADKVDLTNVAGEASVDTQGLWRREMQDWSNGAGQLFLDRRASQDNRFRSSKGINPWTQWYARLLNDTQLLRSSSTITQVMTIGADLYILDDGNVYFTSGTLSGSSSWTTVTGYTGGAATMIATDGANIYIACGSDGIYLSAAGASSASSWVTGTVSGVWYAGGWLFATEGPSLYSVTTATSTTGVLPTALFVATNTSWTWTCAAAGNSWVYIGGEATSGSNVSYVYKTQADDTGTALIVPLVAASLPGGETVYALYAYANYIMMGTSLGARFCETLGINDPGGNAGDLKVGPIVPDQIQQVTKPVRCFVGQFRWVWFGWSNYDGVSTGIGRMDLSQFIDQQAPAYTSDLMVTTSGEVLSMDWFNGAPDSLSDVGLVGQPVFVVSGAGLYTSAATPVTSGNIDFGYATFGLPDQKIGLYCDFYASGSGSVGASISVDDGIKVYTVPSQNLANALTQATLPQLRGELFDTTVTLYSNGTSPGPTLKRFMLKAWPAVVSGTQHKVIVNLFTDLKLTNGKRVFCDPYAEYLYLDGLRQSQTPTSYKEGTEFDIQIIIRAVTRLIYNKRPVTRGGGFNMRLELLIQSLEN